MFASLITSLSKASVTALVCYLSVSAAILPYSSTLPAVNAPFDDVLMKTWEGVKKRMIDPYEIPLVHRPRSEEPHDAVSEGVGYGMLLALYCNDQTYFNKIWDAGEQYMWDDNESAYNWRVNREGTVIGAGAATDADQDIALALIFADLLVKKGTWNEHQSPRGVNYPTRAHTILNSLWNNMVEDGRYLRPGNGWGGRAFVNPGYFAPAFYRVFDEFETEDRAWSGLIDQCYQTIEASPGYEYGLVPDWMQPDGAFAGSLGYNAYAEGHFMYKDAIRVLWRIATDYLWYGEPRAKSYCNNAYSFIQTADKANFFQMDGSAVTDSFVLGNDVGRPRTEHSALTVGMWATTAMAAGGSEAAEPFSDELLSFYENGADYWGRATDPDGEDTLHNEMYFEQFLAWFGASLISGVFTNLWEDFKDPNPEIAAEISGTPEIEPVDINADKRPLTIKAAFSKNVRWTVEINHEDSSNVSVAFSGSGREISLQWSGTSSAGKVMPQGKYKVCISAQGMKNTYQKAVWLGRARNLKSGGRLIVDDFLDGDTRPYFGLNWGSYTEQSDGKNGLTSIKRLEVIDDNGKPALAWGLLLDGSQQIGFDPYGALEWACSTTDSAFTLEGLDTIIIVARCSKTPLEVSLQLVTTDIGDYTYFEDSLSLSTEMKEHIFPVSEFKQRLNGNGAQLNLENCKAIRFQVQGPDGTENEIILEKMLFAGNLANLYAAPPEYLPPPGPWIDVERECFTNTQHKGKVNVIRQPHGITVQLPSTENMVHFSVYSILGEIIFERAYPHGGRMVQWKYCDSTGNVVAPGLYIVELSETETDHRVRLPIHALP